MLFLWACFGKKLKWRGVVYALLNFRHWIAGTDCVEVCLLRFKE